jgi:hypothetical protein
MPDAREGGSRVKIEDNIYRKSKFCRLMLSFLFAIESGDGDRQVQVDLETLGFVGAMALVIISSPVARSPLTFLSAAAPKVERGT